MDHLIRIGFKMKYNPNKFTYKKINKENIEGSRMYLSPDGEKLPSVTTILSATKSEESKKALYEWKKRVGHKQAEAITLEASSRGTRMHKWLENYIKNGEMEEPGSNPYSKQSHQMAQLIIDQGLSKCSEFWGTEVSLYFPKIYAGTTDLVGIHDNTPSIMDHKQSNKLKKKEWIEDYFLQLAAYANAHNEVYGTKIKKGIVFISTQDYAFQEFIIEGAEFDYYSDKWFEKLEQYYTKFL